MQVHAVWFYKERWIHYIRPFFIGQYCVYLTHLLLFDALYEITVESRTVDLATYTKMDFLNGKFLHKPHFLFNRSVIKWEMILFVTLRCLRLVASKKILDLHIYLFKTVDVTTAQISSYLGLSYGLGSRNINQQFS